MTDLWLIWSNEHRAWWGANRWGLHTTEIEEAGRYSREDAAAIVAQATIVPRDPPNEVAVLAPAEPDTSDIPELDEEWFKKARLLKTFIECNPRDITCTVAPDGKSITFHPCGVTSYNETDVEQRYCARCHRWMGLIEVARQMAEEPEAKP
jgi:hypothetical protein